MTTPAVELLARMQHASVVGDWDTVRACVTEGFVNHASPFQGRDGFVGTLQAIAGSMEVTAHEVHDTVEQGDRVVQRTSVSGTHVGSTMPLVEGIPVTGRPFTWDFIHIWRLEGGLLAEHWACRDDLGLRRQLEAP